MTKQTINNTGDFFREHDEALVTMQKADRVMIVLGIVAAAIVMSLFVFAPTVGL